MVAERLLRPPLPFAGWPSAGLEAPRRPLRPTDTKNEVLGPTIGGETHGFDGSRPPRSGSRIANAAVLRHAEREERRLKLL